MGVGVSVRCSLGGCGPKGSLWENSGKVENDLVHYLRLSFCCKSDRLWLTCSEFIFLLVAIICSRDEYWHSCLSCYRDVSRCIIYMRALHFTANQTELGLPKRMLRQTTFSFIHNYSSMETECRLRGDYISLSLASSLTSTLTRSEPSLIRVDTMIFILSLAAPVQKNVIMQSSLPRLRLNFLHSYWM